MKLINFFLTLFTLFLAVLIIINLVISQQNGALMTKLNNAQQTLSRERNEEAVLRTLTLRVAQGALKDPALRDLLVKNQLRATIDVNGQQKEVP